MAGLNLRVGGFGGVNTASTPQYGTAQSYDNVTAAAFGPGYTVPTGNAMSALSPSEPTGLALWVGIAALAGLVAIRYSLPG